MSNLRAFLDTIAFSEGTLLIGDRGYNCLVGSTPRQPLLFGSYLDHPRATIRVRKDNPSTPFDEEILSTAAGRYQILARYFDAYRKTLGLTDFGPGSQDSIATQMLREQKALQDIEAGRLDSAISKARNIWASFPGAGYGQHEHQLSTLRNAYVRAGGKLA